MTTAPTPPDLLVILGPTASGKTRLAVAAARALGGEIISADSRQVFRRMDIGTGKDRAEYGEIPYHLIDILEPGAEFSVFSFLKYFTEEFNEIVGRRQLPILAGGTGLYLDAVLRGYRLAAVPVNERLRGELAGLDLARLQARFLAVRPEIHNSTDLLERERLVRAIEIAEADVADGQVELPAFRPLVFGIRIEREELRRRITARLKERLAAGMIDEAEGLLAEGVPVERLESYGLEYRYLAMFLTGRLSRNDMFQKLNSAIHNFAKKQDTWFRRMEKQGVPIVWLPAAGNQVELLLQEYRRRAA